MKEYKRITKYDRINLQASIEKGYGLKQTAKCLKKKESSIYREIKENSYLKEGAKTCSHCAKSCLFKLTYKNGECTEFMPSYCNKLNKFPYVCNKCNDSYKCRQTKIYYDCEKANEKSEKVKKSSRKRRKLSNDEINKIDEILKDQILDKKQGIHHVFTTNEEINCLISERTLRRYIYDGYFTVKPHNLRNYVKLRHSKPKYAKRSKLNAERLFGRTYDKYKEEVENNGRVFEFQYDSVIGKKTDENAILTITHAETNFQFGYIVKKGVPDSVNKVIENLKAIFKEDYFKIFKINLCDNGTEFEKFYLNEDLKKGTKVFYTDPYKSYHKPECERNHEFIRYFLEKSHSLDKLLQKDLNEMFSQINNYVRKVLDDKTPYDLFVKQFGEKVAETLNIRKIEPKDVNFSKLKI